MALDDYRFELFFFFCPALYRLPPLCFFLWLSYALRRDGLWSGSIFFFGSAVKRLIVELFI